MYVGNDVLFRCVGVLARRVVTSGLSFARAASAPNTDSKSHQRFHPSTLPPNNHKNLLTLLSRLTNNSTNVLGTHPPPPSTFFLRLFPCSSLVRPAGGVQFVTDVRCCSVRTAEARSWAIDVVAFVCCEEGAGERRGRYASRNSTW